MTQPARSLRSCGGFMALTLAFGVCIGVLFSSPAHAQSAGANVPAIASVSAPDVSPDILNGVRAIRLMLEPLATRSPLRGFASTATYRRDASTPAGVMAALPLAATRWLEDNDWTIEWAEGDDAGRVGEARYGTRTIAIWHSDEWPVEFWVGAVVHELGHAVAHENFGDEQRASWNRLRGISSWWWVPGTPSDFSVGEGDFAEAFMNYLIDQPIRSAGGPLSASDIAWIRANTNF